MTTLTVADVNKLRDSLRAFDKALEEFGAALGGTTPANPGPMPDDPEARIRWHFAQARSPDFVLPAPGSSIPQYSYAPFGQQPNSSFAPRNILSVDRLPKTSRWGYKHRPRDKAQV